jgi:hypothetical protein
MNYTNLLKKDIEFGKNNESKLKSKIETFFKCNLLHTNKNNVFDFIDNDKKILIELKTRKNTKLKYPTTMIGYNKIVESIEKIKNGWTIYYIFSFTDKLTYYKFEKDNNEYHSIGGRKDRGRSEFKKYYFIPVELLSDI